MHLPKYVRKMNIRFCPKFWKNDERNIFALKKDNRKKRVDESFNKRDSTIYNREIIRDKNVHDWLKSLHLALHHDWLRSWNYKKRVNLQHF